MSEHARPGAVGDVVVAGADATPALQAAYC